MEDEFKKKRLHIEKITSKLKSHLYLDDIFVDPEQNFIKLLKEIIVLILLLFKYKNFFENDELIFQIKQNLMTIEDFRAKYDESIKMVI